MIHPFNRTQPKPDLNVSQEKVQESQAHFEQNVENRHFKTKLLCTCCVRVVKIQYNEKQSFVKTQTNCKHFLIGTQLFYSESGESQMRVCLHISLQTTA